MWDSDANRYVVDLVDPQPGEVVLDLGAGMGPAVVLAAARGADVVGVEPTRFMRLVLTIRRLVNSGRGRIKIVDATAESIPLADGSVDAVLAVNSVHHWSDPTVAAAEIWRVLKPQGRVVVLDEDFDHPDHERHNRSKTRGDHSHADHLRRHGMEPTESAQMAAMLQAAGFADAEGVDVMVAHGVPAKQGRAFKP